MLSPLTQHMGAAPVGSGLAGRSFDRLVGNTLIRSKHQGKGKHVGTLLSVYGDLLGKTEELLFGER